jgi:hypothetical protein
MKNQITKIALLGLVTAALIAVPSVTRAQDSTNAPAASAHAHHPPIKGKVAAVDTAAMTIKVGETTIVVTSETKITKDAKPATLSDIAVGDTIVATGKKDDSGKFTATKIADGKIMKKKKADDTTAPATPPAQQ